MLEYCTEYQRVAVKGSLPGECFCLQKADNLTGGVMMQGDTQAHTPPGVVMVTLRDSSAMNSLFFSYSLIFSPSWIFPLFLWVEQNKQGDRDL